MSAIGGEENEDENVETHEDVTRKVKRWKGKIERTDCGSDFSRDKYRVSDEDDKDGCGRKRLLNSVDGI